jgi:toxin YoeB
MEIEFSLRALNDLEKWKRSGNKKIQSKISELTHSILENPFQGIGKPESLKHEMSGLWSRRIASKDHYEIQDQLIIILS